VFFWKRAQILTAETWAAFFPAPASVPARHPLLPHGVGQLTMFADYRVPQILHHLCILDYPPQLTRLLLAYTPLAHGARAEVAVRAASIVAVERVRAEIRRAGGSDADMEEVNSVIIDFYLWDLAKRIENGEDRIEGIETEEMIPAHRTRSIWY